jgi:hypothetical protein
LIDATRQEFEQRLAEKDSEIGAREEALRRQSEEVARAKEAIEKQVAERLAAERERIAAEEAKRAKLKVFSDLEERAKEIADLKELLQQRDDKLGEAQKVQVEMLRKQRELDDARRELDLTVEQRVQESLSTIRQKAKKEAEDGLQLKVREKEEQIAAMQKQIELLKRRAEQGSQQLQGEIQELELECLLRERFPRDEIEPVGKGEFGGDIIQRVMSPTSQLAGTILWEIKRTKNWSGNWLAKLRDDQRAAKAEVALIVSHALPQGMDHSFDLIDGVWVTEPRCAIPVAMALRESIISLFGARQAGVGQQGKMEIIYEYLTGPRFRQRVEAIVEKFTDMQEDLEKERKTMTRLWAKREQQIRGVIEATAGMYGDLQGIAGRSLQEVEGLDLLVIEDSSLKGTHEGAET